MKFAVFVFILFLHFYFACNKEKSKEIESYSPPASNDSTITVAQMKKWLSCNPYLDSLSYRYIDSLKTDNPDIRLRHQTNFMMLQDSICFEQGLSGGYDEYIYILKSSGKKQNRKILDSLGIKIF
jgi:hypothetical protein